MTLRIADCGLRIGAGATRADKLKSRRRRPRAGTGVVLLGLVTLSTAIAAEPPTKDEQIAVLETRVHELEAEIKHLKTEQAMMQARLAGLERWRKENERVHRQDAGATAATHNADADPRGQPRTDKDKPLQTWTIWAKENMSPHGKLVRDRSAKDNLASESANKDLFLYSDMRLDAGKYLAAFYLKATYVQQRDKEQMPVVVIYIRWRDSNRLRPLASKRLSPAVMNPKTYDSYTLPFELPDGGQVQFFVQQFNGAVARIDRVEVTIFEKTSE